jgi:membrane-associated phospholipid phosphatase
MHSSPSVHLRDVWDRLRSNALSVDVYTLAIITLYSAAAIVLYTKIPLATSILFQNALIVGVAGASILLTSMTGLQLFRMVRYFYVVPVIYMMYNQTHLIVHAVYPNLLFDDLLIAADRFLFGVDPTIWLGNLASPLLTEYLQICYFMFYLMPILQAVELWRRGDLDALATFARAMAFCYFISYLLYFVMPAIGPRFTLHTFDAISTELPGLFITELLRGLVDAGGGIPLGSIQPDRFVNRDCMPSGHTMLTITNVILAFRNRSSLRWGFAIIGGSLVFSTVYLRYHYAVDVVVGAALVALCLPLEPTVNRLISRWLKPS